MPDVIASSLTALPLNFLISAPLTAAIEAQATAAMSSVDFIREVGFDNNDSVVTVTFSYAKTKDDGTSSTATLTVPLLTIVNVPFLRIQDMTVDFEFKIHQTLTHDVSTSKNGSISASGSANFLKIIKVRSSLKASYSKKEDVKSALDKSATLRIHLRAVQDEMPAGLAETLDLLEASITETVA